MAYEIFDTDVMSEFFGKSQGVAYETRDALPHRVVETLDVIGFPRVLRDSLVLCCRNDPCVDGLIRREAAAHGKLPKIRPQLVCTLRSLDPRGTQ